MFEKNIFLLRSSIPEQGQILLSGLSTHYGERFSISISIDPVKRLRKDGERSRIEMFRLNERFERFFPERQEEEHKESITLSIYPFFTFLLTTDTVFIPFIDTFLILSLSFRHQGYDGINTKVIK